MRVSPQHYRNKRRDKTQVCNSNIWRVEAVRLVVKSHLYPQRLKVTYPPPPRPQLPTWGVRGHHDLLETQFENKKKWNSSQKNRIGVISHKITFCTRLDLGHIFYLRTHDLFSFYWEGWADSMTGFTLAAKELRPNPKSLFPKPWQSQASPGLSSSPLLLPVNWVRTHWLLSVIFVGGFGLL